MYISDCVTILNNADAGGGISADTMNQIICNLTMFEHLPTAYMVSGHYDFFYVKKRYGDLVIGKLMDHMCKSLRGHCAITEWQYIQDLPLEVVQDPKVGELMYTLFFNTWSELRNKNIEYFPYELNSVGKTTAFFSQLRGIKLLELAGL